MAYVDSNTIAAEFGVTPQTVRNWRRRDPSFPAKNIGTEDHPIYRYVIENVEKYLNEKGAKEWQSTM